MSSSSVSVVVHEDQNTATITIGYASNPIIAPVLAIEHDAAGEPSVIYLRSKVHNDGKDYTGWNISGPLTSILTRISEGEAA